MLNGTKPRIALVTPQVVGASNQVRKAPPPLGISSLAAILEQKGYHDILLLDAVMEDYDNVTPVEDGTGFIKYGLPNDKLVEKIADFRADIVGVSSLFSSHTECAIGIADAIKASYPNLPVIFGGNHASQMCEEILRDVKSIDYILAGEADYTLPEFLEKFFNGGDIHEIDGLVWREGLTIRRNPRPAYIKDMNALPFPAWHLYDMEQYFAIGMPHNPFVESNRVGCIFTSRGCPSDCYFCSSPDYMGRTFRAMSSQRVIEMVQKLVDDYDIHELQVLDDNFTVNHRRVVEICEGIAHLNLRITFPNAIRADMPRDREKRFRMFKAMRDAGGAQFGLSPEHGDQEFLTKVVGKAMNLKEVNASCDMAHELGMLVHANFMMGFPFETAALRQKTIDYARTLDADSFSVSLVAPLPGTPLWNIVKENNLFVESFNVSRMVLAKVNIKPHDISPEDLYRLAESLNRELNEAAQKRRPAAAEKYKLFKGKSSEGDRKYHFVGGS